MMKKTKNKEMADDDEKKLTHINSRNLQIYIQSKIKSPFLTFASGKILGLKHRIDFSL